jgi:hypothetical protein
MDSIPATFLFPRGRCATCCGQYQVELTVPELADQLQEPPGPAGKPGQLRASFTVTAPDGEEMVQLATNWPLLEELAAKSGGKVFTAENAGDLLELLNRQAVPHTKHHGKLAGLP